MLDTILQFFLKSGNAFGVLLTRAEARDITQRWISGDYALRGEKYINGMSSDMPWAVLVDEIASIACAMPNIQQTPP